MKIFLQACISVGLIIYAHNTYAQVSDGPKSFYDTYLIENCTVITKPGTKLQQHSVLIKKGIILEVAPSIKAPFDARVIKGDSLYMYAGFISAFSNAGVQKQERRERGSRNEVLQNNNTPPPISINSKLNIHAQFKGDHKSIEDHRKVGFTLVHSVPDGMMIPGSSNLYFTLDKGNHLYKQFVGQTLQLRPAQNQFPSTKIGVISAFRDFFHNSSKMGAYAAMYASKTLGNNRPDIDEDWNAFYPVTTGKMPLFFVAETPNDVHKAISLKKELNFNLVLSEVKHISYHIESVKANNIPVVLSLDIPQNEKPSSVKPYVDSLTYRAFNIKKEAAIKDFQSQAAILAKNNVKFAFSTSSVDVSKTLSNIKLMIENELTEDQALSALTTYPAEILGLSNTLGTIEKGKVANLVLTNKPLFDKNASIQYVFVDGIQYSFNQVVAKDTSIKKEELSLIGTWAYTIKNPMFEDYGKIVFSGDKSNPEITIKSENRPGEELKAKKVEVDGNSVRFTFVVDFGYPQEVDVSLNVDKSSFMGNISVMNQTVPIKGEKLP